MVVKLRRTYHATGTNGQLEVAGALICSTIELPWRNNEKQVSCIPEGTYYLRKRHSTRFNWHVEIRDVPNRKYVLFHPANDALKELKGCIAPVTQLCGAGRGLQSRRAFILLKAMVYKALDMEDDVLLLITS